MKHILEAQQFDRKGITELFKLADRLDGKRNNDLKGKILATLFYEPSTRTRLSFESAMLRLGGSVISTENAKEFSSTVKGETIEDTIRVINEYADAVVIRHFEEGSAARAAAVSGIPVINGGDGAGQHPTQSLLDLYTIERELGSIDKKRITFVGDLAHSRTIRSLAYFLGKYDGISMTFVSPPELTMKGDIKEYLGKHGIRFTETTSLDEGIRDADVVYQNRIQRERFEGETAPALDGKFVLTRARADAMKPKSIIMNPLPRVGELLPEVDSSPKAVYFRQAKYGVLIRMALLKMLLG